MRPRLGEYRPPLARMQRIATLLRKGKAFTVKTVAVEFEMCDKTITRDMLFMRDRLGWNFDFDPKANTYKFVSAPEPVL